MSKRVISPPRPEDDGYSPGLQSTPPRKTYTRFDTGTLEPIDEPALISLDEPLKAMANLDKEQGYMGTFVQMSNFPAKELYQFVARLKQNAEPDLHRALRSLSAHSMRFDYRWGRRHTIQHVTVSILCLILSILMVCMISDLTVTHVGRSPGFAVAVSTCVISWISHWVMSTLFFINIWFPDCFAQAAEEESDSDDDDRGAGAPDPLVEDPEHPKSALVMEARTAKTILLFNLSLLTVFLQFFVYMFLFAYYYPQLCPTERGSYSCQRMSSPIVYPPDKKDTFWEYWYSYPAPRFVAEGSTFPWPTSTGTGEIPESDKVPQAGQVPYFLYSPKEAKEMMAVFAHCVPILYGAYWIIQNRRVGNLLIAWSNLVSGKEPLSEADPEQGLPFYRQSLMFLAMCYHTVVPHAKHVMHRFGSLVLDLIDVQDFWMLLIDFDLYEGRDIEEPYWSALGFNFCNMTDYKNVVCNCPNSTAPVPAWWVEYQDKYSPCQILQDASSEWATSHNEVWEGLERSGTIANTIFPKSRMFLVIFIQIWWVITVILIFVWPVVLYFRMWSPTGKSDREGCCKRGFRSGTTGKRQDRNNVDNREALWNAVRAWIVNSGFLAFRIYASAELGILASSLLIKNVFVVVASLLTISQYFVWSWVNPNRWPELVEKRGCTGFCDRTLGWCCVSRIPRWWFLRMMYWWLPKPMVIEIELEVITIDNLMYYLGQDDENFYSKFSHEGRAILKAGFNTYFVFPKGTADATSPLSKVGKEEVSADHFDIMNNNFMRYEDFDCEKHVAMNLLKGLN